MNELQIFDYGQKSIRTVDVDGNPWFSGKDVAEALGYSDTDDAIRRHCKLLKLFKPGETPGLECGPRGMVFIPEPDVYRLAAKSTLPSAEEFEAWIFEEVIPSIRKTGSYGMDPIKALNDPATMRQLLLNYSEKCLEQEKTIKQLQPKAFFADCVNASDNGCLVRELAKILAQSGVMNTGQNRLYQELRDRGYIIKQRGLDYNLPTQRSIDLKIMYIHEGIDIGPDGTTRLVRTTRITGKGQRYFVELFAKETGKTPELIS